MFKNHMFESRLRESKDVYMKDHVRKNVMKINVDFSIL